MWSAGLFATPPFTHTTPAGSFVWWVGGWERQLRSRRKLQRRLRVCSLTVLGSFGLSNACDTAMHDWHRALIASRTLLHRKRGTSIFDRVRNRQVPGYCCVPVSANCLYLFLRLAPYPVSHSCVSRHASRSQSYPVSYFGGGRKDTAILR